MVSQRPRRETASLAEGVEFETEEDFRNKVNTIKESYFTRKAELAESASEPTEEVSEPLVEETTSGTMSKYVDAIARWSK